MSDIIEIEDASFSYPGNIRALDNFSAHIVRGGRTVVLGLNGSGKTTLFSLLIGLQCPQNGRILFDGNQLSYDRPGLLKLRQAVGMVFQDPDSQLFSACIYEDISFGPLNLGLGEAEVRARVERSLRQMRLEGVEHRPTHSLSFGQKKRACIAGVLAMQPDVLVLDEPFGGLDPIMTAEFMTILDELHRGGTTMVIATHDLDLAYSWSDDVIVMQAGRLLMQGLPDDVLVHPEVTAELGAVPVVAEVTRSLVLTGIDVCANGYLPRSRADLIRSIAARTIEESSR